jgi:hypothetical protein
VTGIIGRVGTLFFQPGQLGFQVAYPLVKTVQLGGQELVRAAGVTEESLRHDGSLPASPRVLRLPWQQARLQTRCIACGGGMEMSTPSSSSLRRVCTPAADSETSWPPPDAPREAVSAAPGEQRAQAGLARDRAGGRERDRPRGDQGGRPGPGRLWCPRRGFALAPGARTSVAAL